MLREHKDIDRHSHWSDCKKKLESDWRYRLVESATAREDWFRDYIRILKEERKKEKERDKDHRHREKEHHKSDKKDKEKKDGDKYKDKSKEKIDKESSKEKKQRRSEANHDENGKEKLVVEKEAGEVDEPDEKKIKTDNNVSILATFNIP